MSRGRRRGPLVVLGDVLLDRDLVGAARRLAPEAAVPVIDSPRELRRPGGAGLAALLAARDGREVVLVTPLGDGPAARSLRALLEPEVRVIALGCAGPPAEKVRVRAGDHPVVRLDRPGADRVVSVPEQALAALREAGAVLVSDYGRGAAAHPAVRAALSARSSAARLVWDPHPRGAVPVPGATLACPNLAEATAACAGEEPTDDSALTYRQAARCAQELAQRWRASAVAVTLGSAGALLSNADGSPLIAPARQVPCVDACGAGDRFASAAAGALQDGALTHEAVMAAVEAASAFVAAGGAAAVRAGPEAREHPLAMTDEPSDGLPSGRHAAARAADRVRASGGTIVATGGCFDVLHAGHVALLRAARSFGDLVVVLLNSDASVRRLKGPNRPVNPVADRIAVLRALEQVDVVAVFEESSPHAALAELRPHLWVKGGDYAHGELPEAELVASWGGQAVLAPYLADRSTTSIVTRLAGAHPHASGPAWQTR